MESSTDNGYEILFCTQHKRHFIPGIDSPIQTWYEHESCLFRASYYDESKRNFESSVAGDRQTAIERLKVKLNSE